MKALIADDEVDIRDGVRCWLTSAQFQTIEASDGSEAVELAHDVLPDVILMDVMMPKKDGMEALSDLRASSRTSDIPVVMLSASLRDEQRALDAGATYFLHKPYCGKYLLAAVKASIDAES